MRHISVIILISSFSLLHLKSGSNLVGKKIMKAAEVFQLKDNPDLNDYDVKFYFIDLEVSDTSAYIRGSTSILIELQNPKPQYIILDMAGTLHVDSVLLNSQRADYLHHDDQLKISKVPDALYGNLINIQVFYDGTGINKGSFAGLYHSEDKRWNKWVTWTLSEPYSAKNWFPCKQDLNDKADSVYVFLTTNNDLLAGSNGLLTNQILLPGNKIRHEWKSYYPIAYYLISFAVSDYRDYSLYAKSGYYDDSVLIQNYIYDNDLFFIEYKHQIDTTAKLMELFSELFGPYPFREEKYGHCIVPSGGGMEHQTMTTLDHFYFELIAHELAHQWFGDYVTCGTWQDIWINEGFASYAEYLGYQYLISQEDADRWMSNAHHIIQYSKHGSLYIPSNEVQNESRIFDFRLSYKKGAAMIHMIRHEINNDELFFKILKDFLTNHQNGTAVGTDFKNLLEYKTGKDFTDFFNQWYFGEGYPVHSINWRHHNDTLYISSMQTPSSSTPLFNILIDFKVTANGKDTLITVRQNTNYENWHMYIPGKVTCLQVDPNQWLLLDLRGLNRQEHDMSGKDIVIKPNPLKDPWSIEINAPPDIHTLYLVDATGKILLSNEQYSSNITLDVEEFSKGVYNIILIDEHHNLFQVKFVKD